MLCKQKTHFNVCIHTTLLIFVLYLQDKKKHLYNYLCNIYLIYFRQNKDWVFSFFDIKLLILYYGNMDDVIYFEEECINDKY